MGELVGRRTFLKAAGALGLLALAPQARVRSLLAATAPGQAGHFLTAKELDTLRAMTDRFIPGSSPTDPDPGAVDAGCAEAIDLMLAAFTFTPPLIHAGGPFSDRAGATHNDFASFVPMDPLVELGWRIRIEGSLGKKEREFAGPVVGLQEQYRKGLAHVNDKAGGDFTALPAPLQDALLKDQTDQDLQGFVGLALTNTLEAMYGNPEYGGNRNLVGWKTTHWPGDTQPRGFTPAEVSTPESATLGMSQSQAQDALKKFAPAFAGEAASTAAFWRGRPGLERG